MWRIEANGLALAHAHAIEHLLRNADLGIGARLALKFGEDLKNALHRSDARQHAILFRQNGCHRFLLRIDRRQGSGVARGLVFQQGVR